MQFLLIISCLFCLMLNRVYPANRLMLPDGALDNGRIPLSDRSGERFGRNSDRRENEYGFFDENNRKRLEREEQQRQRDQEEIISQLLRLGSSTSRNAERNLQSHSRRQSVSGAISVLPEGLSAEQRAREILTLAEGYGGAHSRERHGAVPLDYLTHRHGPRGVTSFSTQKEQDQALAQANAQFMRDRDTFGSIPQGVLLSDVESMSAPISSDISFISVERAGRVNNISERREGPAFVREMSGGTVTVVRRNGMPYTCFPNTRV